MGAFQVLLSATIRMATALVWPSLGELLIERTGLLNIGLEASVLWGALGGLIGALAIGSPWGGVAAGVLFGGLVGLAFAALVEGLNLNAVLSGTALNLIAVGGTGFIYRRLYGQTGTGSSVPMLGSLVPGWADIPVVGAVFGQTILFVLAVAAAGVTGWFLSNTREGVRWRACGEDPEAASLQGVPVKRTRLAASILGGAMAGVGGAFLVVASTGVFVERMSAGRGFMALAVVVLARWRAGGVWLAALLFGFAAAFQFFFQALGTGIAYQWLLMLPYGLTLLVLTVRTKRDQAPALLR